MTEMTVANPELLALFEAIDNDLSSAKATAAAAEQVVDDQATTITAQKAQIAALQAQINRPVIGLAIGTSQAAWNAAPSKGATVLRVYGPKPTEPAPGVPALWPKMPAAAVKGPTGYVISYNPDTDLTAGDGPKTSTWGASLPNGSRVTAYHEPEQASKPTHDLAVWSSVMEFYMPLLKAANPTLKAGAIFQCWVDDVSTPGKNAWLTALAGGKWKPDYVGWDLYQKASAGYPSAEQLLGPCLDLADQTWPGIEQIVAEWGVSGSGDPRAACITASYAYMASRGVTTVIYFDENVANQEAWLLNGDAAAVAAFEGLGVAA
jgi:hypothetical protein